MESMETFGCTNAGLPVGKGRQRNLHKKLRGNELRCTVAVEKAIKKRSV